MLRFLKTGALAIIAVTALSSISAQAGKFGLGAPASKEMIEAWDIDVRPDGQGLPQGKGSVAEGEEIFAEKCATCHGDFGEGIDRWPVLAGGSGTLASEDPVKTVGSYWPYLSTVYDYIRRAMPFGNAQSMTPDEIYATTAYILHMNDIVEADFVLSKDNFTSIRLPNEKAFTTDTRPDTPTLSAGEPCMNNCKDDVKITGRARILDVTPDEETEGASLE